MINITFDSKKLELNIEGHAGAEEKGKDIVCAAVSALFYTLVRALNDSRNMLKKKPAFKDNEGKGFLRCMPRRKYERNIQLMYWTVLEGLQLVSENYKDFVNFVIVG